MKVQQGQITLKISNIIPRIISELFMWFYIMQCSITFFIFCTMFKVSITDILHFCLSDYLNSSLMKRRISEKKGNNFMNVL